VTALTETTHYTYNNDIGEIIITTAGATAIGANSVFGAYKYSGSINESKMQTLIDASVLELDRLTNNHWCDGSVTTPNWNVITEEKHKGQGNFNLDYYLDNYPISNTSTTLNGAVSADDGTITVVSTNGFPSSGSFNVDGDRIDYTGKDATNFTGCTSVEAHDDSSSVYSFVLEISNTAEGTVPAWTVATNNSDFDLAFDIGRVRLMRDDLLNDTSTAVGEVPQNGTPNRFRFSGLAGNNTVPAEVNLLTLLLVGKKLFNSQVLNALSRGTNGFETGGLEDVQKDIDRLLRKLRHVQSDNT